MFALAALPHRRFTVDEYHYLIDKGVFAPDERLELWEGELIEMSPIGKRRAGCVAALTELLRDLTGSKAIVWAQNPIVLNDLSEPQPDLCLLNRRKDFYRTSDAKAADVLLVIEVADSTVEYDRNHKLPGYAKNGIAEAWLIDLNGDRVEIHTNPSENGYGLVQILHRGQTAKSTVIPEVHVLIEDIFG